MSGSEWFGALPGGLNRYFEDLFVALSRRPDVEVRAAAFGDPLADGDSWGGVDSSLAERVLSSRRHSRSTEPAPDILDRHFAAYGPSKAAVNPGALVAHFQGPWFAESRAAGEQTWRVGLKKQWERRRYAEVDRAVVFSEAFGRILVEELSFPEDRVQVIPPGVDLERFPYVPYQDSSRPSVLCVRRLEYRMGVDVLLAAWPAVLTKFPEARLDVVGDGSCAPALKRQAEGTDLHGSVTFHGQIDDLELSRLYGSALASVVPTRSLEGFGLIALESLASGRPAIVTDVGGLPDAVRALDGSLVVPSEDVGALADRIVAALDGHAPSGSRCRRHAEGFSWALVAQRHVDLYREVTR